MTALDVHDPAALARDLDAVREGHWIRVVVSTTGYHDETYDLVRVPGGWVLPGDVVIASGDVCDGQPVSVVVLGDLFGEDPFNEEDNRV